MQFVAWINGIWQPGLWEMVSRLLGYVLYTSQWGNDLHQYHFVQSMAGLHHTCQPLDLWIKTTMDMNSKLKQGGCRFCTISNCIQQQGITTTLQEWRLLCSRTSNASIIWSMLSVSHWGWRRMGKQFITSRHPCMLLMLIPLASSLQHWAHCCLDWSPYQDLCTTPKTAISWPSSSWNLVLKESFHQN